MGMAGGTPVVFGYSFDHPTRVQWNGGEALVAQHAIELPFVFAFSGGPWPWNVSTTAEWEFASEMTAYWSSFATTADPNSGSLPEWPRYSVISDTVMRLQTIPEG